MRVIPLAANFISILLVWFFLGLACSQSTSPPDRVGIALIDFYPSWSAENNLIAFIHNRSLDTTDTDSSGIYVIKPDGTEKRLIYKDRFANSVDWSPDGSKLIANGNERIVMISFPEVSVDTLTGIGEYWGLEWSPDGTQFAFAWRRGPERGIYIWDLAGDSLRLVAPYGNFVNWPYEDSLIYLDQSQPYPNVAIVISDTAGIFKRRIYTPNEDIIRSSVSAKLNVLTGRIIIEQQKAGEYSSIWKMNQNGAGAVKLRNYAMTPEFYSNGDSIIFSNIREDNGRLWIINWDDTGLRQLTH